MEDKKKMCSFEDHKGMEAISFCSKCQIFMCIRCINQHAGLFKNHPINDINKSDKELFTGFCQEENHNNKLEYFCKNHNQLCCDSCIIKMSGQGKGQHKDCDICFIKDIKEEKKNKLIDNINTLEKLNNEFQESIKEFKIIYDKLNEDRYSKYFYIDKNRIK